MTFLLARVGLSCAFSTLGFASTLACPTSSVASIVSSGDISIGDNTTIVQNRRVNGIQVEIGVNSRASNGVASIVSGGGVRVGDGTTILQTGCIDRTQVVVGPGSRVQVHSGANASQDCQPYSATIRITPGTITEPMPPGEDEETVDVRTGCASNRKGVR